MGQVEFALKSLPTGPAMDHLALYQQRPYAMPGSGKLFTAASLTKIGVGGAPQPQERFTPAGLEDALAFGQHLRLVIAARRSARGNVFDDNSELFRPAAGYSRSPADSRSTDPGSSFEPVGRACMHTLQRLKS